jgi:NADH-quinone oxidoreductase subunit A
LGSYIPIAVMIAIAAVIAGAMVGGSLFLGPKKPGEIKSTAYECGMVPVGNARERFPIKFYLIAMLFIVFDIETIFLYPWAVAYHGLGHDLKVFNLIEMAIFVAILFAGYFYILGKGALDWDESDQARNVDVISPAVVAPRAAIRFGNEKSGPVDTGKTPVGPRFPVYGASSQEAYQSLPQSIHNQELPPTHRDARRVAQEARRIGH